MISWKTETSLEAVLRKRCRRFSQDGVSGLKLAKFKMLRSHQEVYSPTCKQNSERLREWRLKRLMLILKISSKKKNSLEMLSSAENNLKVITRSSMRPLLETLTFRGKRQRLKIISDMRGCREILIIKRKRLEMSKKLRMRTWLEILNTRENKPKMTMKSRSNSSKEIHSTPKRKLKINTQWKLRNLLEILNIIKSKLKPQISKSKSNWIEILFTKRKK